MTTTPKHRVFHWLQKITTSVVLPCLLYILSLGKTLHEAFYLLADDIPLLGQAHGLYVWFRAVCWIYRWSPDTFLRATVESAHETLTAVEVGLASKWNNAVNVWTTEFESLTSTITKSRRTLFTGTLKHRHLAVVAFLGLSVMLLASIHHILMRRRADRRRLQSTQNVQESLTCHRTVRFSPTQELISNAPADNDGSRYVDLVETRPGVFSPVKRCCRLRGLSI